MKKRIVYISPGPTWWPHSPEYQENYLALSKKFKGYILTTSTRMESIQIGNFMLKSIAFTPGVRNSLKFARFCIEIAWRIRAGGQRIDLVATYDPLKTGLIGLIVARILQAKLATEVNGVYTSKAVLLDEKNKKQAMIKRAVYLMVMRLVVRYSEGLRLLYREQLGPFRTMVQGKIVRAFSRHVATERFDNIEERKVVLLAGSPYKLKGVDILIEAFKRIAPKYPEWKLKILGWFEDPTELIGAIGDHPQIFHHPAVKPPEMPSHIGSCGIFVLPSRSEAMGRVLLEAMAAGKARIGARVDGIPTVINDGVDGLLFKPEDVGDLASKLDLLMRNPELREKLGEAGKSRAEREFRIENYIKNVTEFYLSVIGNERQTNGPIA